MWSTMITYLFVSACISLLVLADARPFGVSPTVFSGIGQQNTEFLNQPQFAFRGGDSSTVLDSDGEYDFDVDDSDIDESEDESEDEEESTSKLLASAKKATTKAQTKKTATAKKAINSGLAEAATKPAKKKKSMLRLPYIVRACANPFTLLAMTKAYFASLFNLEYAKKVRFVFAITVVSFTSKFILMLFSLHDTCNRINRRI